MWMPGAGFKRKASEVKRLVRRMLDTPFEMVKDAMVSLLGQISSGRISCRILCRHLVLPLHRLPPPFWKRPGTVANSLKKMKMISRVPLVFCTEVHSHYKHISYSNPQPSAYTAATDTVEISYCSSLID